MRRLVIGDIHGSYKGLIQVFEHAKFDYEKDMLICLGDVVDGWLDSKQCIEELIKVKNLTMILGNHDKWFLDWAQGAEAKDLWLYQGGWATINSYGIENRVAIPDIPKSHKELFLNARAYFISPDNKLFVHGGFDEKNKIEDQAYEDLMWDRTLFESVVNRKYEKQNGGFSEMFIGHTTTERFSLVPVKKYHVWLMDQGAGWGGKLSLMDIDTKEFWVSEFSNVLYEDFRGRSSAG